LFVLFVGGVLFVVSLVVVVLVLVLLLQK